ncbi:hypothetical protein L3V82_05035 [Thiotrichales bacterium 19S3-7]|nr:hypothetical protein [Thiotrichales bacterium 19S3-7]MCF6801457.1 hypothetical protein [Thiotrichales bacterium 19S3-11]
MKNNSKQYKIKPTFFSHLARLGVLLIVFYLPYVADAKTVMHGEFVNNTTDEITVKKTGSHCWYDDDLSGSHTIAPGATWSFKTEDKDSGSCYDDGAAITTSHYINLSVSSDSNGTRNIQLNSHMSAGWHDHCGDSTDTNIDISGGCNYNVKVNPLGSPLTFKIKSIGLGKVSETACGSNLTSAYDGTPYIQCTSTTDDGSNYVNILNVNFSSSGSACNILVKSDGTIQTVNCDNNVSYDFTSDKDVVFLCQQADSNSSTCPWLVQQTNSDDSYKSIQSGIYT